MKKIILTTLLALGVSSASLIAADGGTKLGVGVALDGRGGAIKVPINLGVIMVEPEFSVYKNDPDVGPTVTTYSVKSGVYYVKPVDKSLNMYVGGKLGVNHYDVSGAGGTTTDNVTLAAIGGFEYFIAPQVSVGGDVGLELGAGDNSTIQTIGSTTLRYYF